MKSYTSDLLAISFDCISSPSLKLSLQKGNPLSSGWGFGWYPGDDYASSVVKDTGVAKVESITSAVSDWRHFRSTTFLCKVKGAAKRPSQQDTQPFQRSFWGRDWLFLHNGDLDIKRLSELFGEMQGFLHPLGSTDSELAFCYLLQQFERAGAKRIADLDPTHCMTWFTQLDDLGVADVVISDGQSILSFHGKNSARDLFYARLTPPHADANLLINDALSIDFTDPRDAYRSAFLVSSSLLNGVQWHKMSSGQMMIVRRGATVYNSHQAQDSAGKALLPASIPESARPGQPIPAGVEFVNIHGAKISNGPVITNLKSIVREANGKALEYRQFKVSHLTEFNYLREVERSTHVLRLQPVEDKTQEVIQSTLTFSVDGEQIQFEDVFGNQSMHVTLDQPYTKLSMLMESEVKIYASPVIDFSNPMRRTSIPMVWMPWQRQMMLPYLLPPELPEPQLLELTEFALSFVERADYNLIDTLSEMNQQIYRDFSYVQGQTDFATTPFDVYSSRRGVCQDFANLLICLARLLNIPARYRVGYIHTGANYANKLQSEASHAWVEVYLPYLGWRGFDPTNGCAVEQEHIRVACGRNFRDAAPTTGTLYKGGGGETLFVSVKVEETAKT